MASTNKRSWKFQDFTAHDANVNCLALGHKSGRVLVTGGDDKKVNLWAIGKQSYFMSLSGHTTPIECVQFNHREEQVCAGSRAGALKVWDLEAAKLVRTLNGHKYTIKAIDFYPYGDSLASGSGDCSIKMWDSRKKDCISTYNGHKSTVNSLKFSPDGLWIASGSDDSTVKIWDLRVGRILKEFQDHIAPVTCVQFHPHEFLLATGSSDRSVHIFDLENFQLVSSEVDIGSVRCLYFNPEGECLFTGVRDYMKVVGWEPNRIYDSVPVNWGRIADMSAAPTNQLIGASFHLTSVEVYIVDLAKVQPLGKSIDAIFSPFTPNQSIRKSFSKAELPVTLKARSLVKTIEESTSGTDPEEDQSANITNITDYNEIFKGKSIIRTPPPLEEETFQEPEHDYTDPTAPQTLRMSDSFEALSLDNNLNNYRNISPPAINDNQYSRSKSNLDEIYTTRLYNKPERENILPNINASKTKLYVPTPKYSLQRQSSCKDVPEKNPRSNGNMRQSLSEANISKNTLSARNATRKNSFSRPNRNSINTNVSKVSNLNSARSSGKLVSSTPVDIYVNSKLSPEEDLPLEVDEFVPVSVDKPVGLDLDDFLPKNKQTFGYQQQVPSMSEAEVLGVIMRGHEPMMSVIATRQKSLKLVLAQFRSKDIKAAIEVALAMDDQAVLVDLLGVFNSKYSIWNLDLCVLILPKVKELLQSKFETYITTGCATLKLVLKNFGPVIRTNITAPVGSFGVDIPREERYRKSVKCHETLLGIRSYILKKQSAPGNLGIAFKEINCLMQNAFD